jgi:F0F1-type ATP synthase delta subunit
MSAPATSRQIAAALLSLLDDGEAPSRVADATAAYLVSERRSKDRDAIMHDLLELRAAQGTVEAVATSAHDLNDTVRRELKLILSEQFKPGTKVALHEVSDPAAIGGVRVEAPDLQLDLTIKHRLQQFASATNESRKG